MTNIKSIHSCHIDLTPSCLEFLPNDDNFLLIGTYLLDISTQKRHGSLVLMRRTPKKLEVILTLELDYGILHLQFSPHRPSIVCTANSTGDIAFYKIDVPEQKSCPEITQMRIAFLGRSDVLALYLVWHPEEPDLIGVTLSNGEILLVTVTESQMYDEPSDLSITSFQAHELEAWFMAFPSQNRHIPKNSKFLSGGDDSKIILVDYSHTNKESKSEIALHGAIWSNSRIHQAGVTSILPLTSIWILTGSYDDRVRLLKQNGKGYQDVYDLNLEGGVWRMKLLPLDVSDRYFILASCMHVGARILEVSLTDENPSITIVERFEEHKSMNYASDVLVDGTKITVVSTSYYDKLVCLWEFEIDSKLR